MIECAFLCVLVFTAKCAEIPPNKANPNLQIRLPDGVIQGARFTSFFRNTTYYGFLRIPFAEPPVGKLRFRPPVPVGSWSGVLDATKDGPECVQFSLEKVGQVVGSEDCLYLNVYTPKIPKSAGQLLPVMVWIFGGAFIYGSGQKMVYGPDYLIEHEVVIVALNYRVGVFGFLSTGDMASPGNYGLKDQLLSLKWVKKNIEIFGGDPNKVTIFGESAGAASVNYLIQASKADGLFQQAISQSGSSLCPWARSYFPRRIAKQVGIAAGIFPLNSASLVQKLRNLDYKRLQLISLGTTILNLINAEDMLPYSPTIEPAHSGAIMTRKSHALLKSGKFNKVSHLMGFNSGEVTIFAPVFGIGRALFASWDISPRLLTPLDMNINKLSRIPDGVGSKIKAFYTNGLALSTDKNSIAQYFNDHDFIKPIVQTAKMHRRFSSVYFYELTFKGKLGMTNTNTPRGLNGVAHSEDLWYLWKGGNLQAQNVRDLNMVQKMTKLWTNFAKFGNPTPTQDPKLDDLTWKPLTDSSFPYVKIGETLMESHNPREEAMKFWDDLYDTFGRPPYDTY